jgi:hypothetical protein
VRRNDRCSLAFAVPANVYPQVSILKPTLVCLGVDFRNQRIPELWFNLCL